MDAKDHLRTDLLARIRDARHAIEARIHRTPLLSSRALCERMGAEGYIKAEVLQKTGSFKVRGALNKVRGLSAEERARGLVTVSAGNHAQGVAYAAAAYGARATVVMPATAPRSKIEACRSYGAEVVLCGTIHDAFRRCEELRRENGYTLVHPFDDLDVIAGQGTVGLEVLDELPEPDVVVVPVGGGALLAGIAAAIKALRPSARVIGVEPSGACGLTEALRAGRVVRLDRVDTIADGLGAPATSELVLEQVRDRIEDVVVLEDDEIVRGMAFLLERAKLLAEPAGAAAVAAILTGRVDIRSGERAVAIASGGNVDLARLKELLPG